MKFIKEALPCYSWVISHGADYAANCIFSRLQVLPRRPADRLKQYASCIKLAQDFDAMHIKLDDVGSLGTCASAIGLSTQLWTWYTAVEP